MSTNFTHWYNLTKVEYNAIKNISNADFYYITDTKELYKGTKKYNGLIKLVSSLPNIPVSNTIYINTKDNCIYVYYNGEWVTIVKPLGEVVDTNNSNPVSGKAVKDYVDPKYNKLSYDINIERTRIDNIATITNDNIDEIIKEIDGTNADKFGIEIITNSMIDEIMMR